MPGAWRKMAEIVNLNRARKTKSRAEKQKTAQANRVAHGTPKALRKLSDARKDQADQHLTGHKLHSDDDS